MENLIQRVKNAFFDNKRRFGRGIAISAIAAYGLLGASPLLAAPSYQDPTTEITSTNTITNTDPITPTYTLEEELKTIYAKEESFTDYECNESEWHFVINQIPEECAHPDGINAILEANDGQIFELFVPWDSSNQHMAHYRTTEYLNANLTFTEATAEICEQWDGEFVLSHGPCGTTDCGLVDFKAYSPAQSSPLQSPVNAGKLMLLGLGIVGATGYATQRFRKKSE